MIHPKISRKKSTDLIALTCVFSSNITDTAAGCKSFSQNDEFIINCVLEKQIPYRAPPIVHTDWVITPLSAMLPPERANTRSHYLPPMSISNLNVQIQHIHMFKYATPTIGADNEYRWSNRELKFMQRWMYNELQMICITEMILYQSLKGEN